jgi:hypothetical protein
VERNGGLGEEEAVVIAESPSEGSLEEAVSEENITEHIFETDVEAFEGEKGGEPVVPVEETPVSAIAVTLEEPVQTSPELVEDSNAGSAGTKEEVVIDQASSELAPHVFSNEGAVTAEVATEVAVEENFLEEPIAAVIEDRGLSPLIVPEEAEQKVEQKVEEVLEVEQLGENSEPEDEAPYDIAAGIEEKGEVPDAEVKSETIPAVTSEIPLEASLEEPAALHEEISTSSFAPEPKETSEAEAGPAKLFESKEEGPIVEALAPEDAEETNSGSSIVAEEEGVVADIPDQEPEADNVTVVLEGEAASPSDVPLEAAEDVEDRPAGENGGERSLFIEEDAEPSPAAISQVDLGVSSEFVEENSGDGTQVVEEHTALNLGDTAGPPTEAAKEVVEATEPIAEASVAYIEMRDVVTISGPEPSAGTREDAEEYPNVVEEVVPSSEASLESNSEVEAVELKADEPITTLVETEVEPTPASAYKNVEENNANEFDQAIEVEDVPPGHFEAVIEQVEIEQKEGPAAEIQPEQRLATDQDVDEAVAIIEAGPATDPVVAPEVAAFPIEETLGVVAPTVEKPIEPATLGTEVAEQIVQVLDQQVGTPVDEAEVGNIF